MSTVPRKLSPAAPPKKARQLLLTSQSHLGKETGHSSPLPPYLGTEKERKKWIKKKREKKMILQTCDHRNGRGQGTNFSNVYDDVSALFFLSFGRCLKATPTDGSTKTASSSSSSVAILGEADVSTATIHFQVSQVSRSEASALIHHVVRMYESKIKTGGKQWCRNWSISQIF